MKSFTFTDFSMQGNDILTIQDQICHGDLVHALLISGEPGTGKKTLAGIISSALMCKEKARIPCGTCSACRMASAGEHPDITVIEKGTPLSPETPKGRSTIPVDDIREMIRLCSQYSFEGGNRVVIIRDAEDMTVQAQNCLLKILEEPPQNTYFILTASHPEQLLTTVRSRCRPIKVCPWETSYIIKMLTEAGVTMEKAEQAASLSEGSIGKAFMLVSDEEYWNIRDDIMNAFFRNTKRSNILKYSSAWKDRKKEAEILFDILDDSIHRLLMYRINPDKHNETDIFPAEWLKFAAEASIDRFTDLSDRIKASRKEYSYNVNYQAIVEQLLLAFIGEHEKWVN